ncbi:hypothetical protein [Rosettibacter firmus]|uniref:hypothetical protein n=1 Tax=Rosettibacter firmus TaxID=3111522 RepID=UPI00336C1BE2
MKKKHYKTDKEESIKNNVIFCAECGEALTFFGVEPGEVDLNKIKERHKNCKNTGKFKGDKCAMLFIAESNEDLFLEDEE